MLQHIHDMYISAWVQIPDGQSWLCWRGCPQGLTTSNSSADRNAGHTVPAHSSRSGTRPSAAAVLRGRTLAADPAEWNVRSGRGSLERGAGELPAGAAAAVARGPAKVHVAGVALDLVPVWLRFGHVVTMADVEQRDTSSSGSADGGGTPAAGRRDDRQEPMPHHVEREHIGDAATVREKSERLMEGVRLRSEVLVTSQGSAGDRVEGRRRRVEATEHMATAAGGGTRRVNESVIDFGGVLTAEAALQRPRWAAVLLAAGGSARGMGAGALTGVWYVVFDAWCLMDAGCACMLVPSLLSDAALLDARSC